MFNKAKKPAQVQAFGYGSNQSRASLVSTIYKPPSGAWRQLLGKYFRLVVAALVPQDQPTIGVITPFVIEIAVVLAVSDVG